MDDIDAFLESLEQFSAPSIFSGIHAYQSSQASQERSQDATGVQAVSHSEVNQRAADPAGTRERKRRRRGTAEAAEAAVDGEHARQEPRLEGVPDTALPAVNTPAAASDGVSAQPRQQSTSWTCSTCTLVNRASARRCAACEAPKPAVTASTSQSVDPSVSDVASVQGQCVRCTFLNEAAAPRCVMCDGPLPRVSAAATTSATTGESTAASQASEAKHLSAVPNATGTNPEGQNDRDDEDDEGEDDSDDDDFDDSSDSDASGFSSSDDQDDGTSHTTSDKDALDNRELVKFLQTLEAVPYDQLPLAPVPPTMRFSGQLKPFQRQALHWLQSQEAGTSALGSRAGPSRDRAPVPVDLTEDEFDCWDGQSRPQPHAGSTGSATVSAMGFRHTDGRHDHLFSGAPSSNSSKEALQSVRGGIFSDYMGLGKTRTMIALCEATSTPRLRQLQMAQSKLTNGSTSGTRATGGATPSTAGFRQRRRTPFQPGRVERITGSQVVSEATLIVCPTSLLRQWAAEIHQCVDTAPSAGAGAADRGHASAGFAPAPRILLYHGARRKRMSMFDIAENYDYVLTSYQTLRHENMPTASTAGAMGGSAGTPPHPRNEFFSVDATMREAPPGKLFMIDWKRVILDEAHVIRNARAKMSRACMKLTARYKWVVTATPVQNSLNDLFPLLKFLEVPHFGNLQWWNEEIVRYFNMDPNHQRPVTALRMLFSSLLLRRTPDSVVNGVKILDLPPKEMRTEYIVLSRKEQLFYDAVHVSATQKIDAAAQRQREAAAAVQAAVRAGEDRWAHNGVFQRYGSVDQGLLSAPPPPLPRVNRLTTFSTAFEMLMRCRQTCLHPYIVVAALRRCHANGRHSSSSSSSNDVFRLGQGTPAGDSAVLASSNARDAEAEAKARAEEEEQRRTAAAIDAFIDGVLKRIIAVGKKGEFVKELIDELRKQKLEDRECIICLDTLARPTILPCGHTFCEDCITHALSQVKRACPVCKRSVAMSKVLVVPENLLRKERPPAEADATAAAAGGGAASAPVDVAAEVADVDVANLDNWSVELSAKTRYLLEALRTIPAEEKVIVFSGFTKYLDFAKHCLDAAGVPCVMYTGALTLKQKDDVIGQFTGAPPSAAAEGEGSSSSPSSRANDHGVSAPSPRVLLASISACGVGLNLVCANHCFLMDPMWNPGAEDQALNRIHRIGQTRPVSVVKLIAKGTVEEKMEQLNECKRRLNGYCFTGGSMGGRLRAEELMALFANDDDDEDDDDEEESDENDGTRTGREAPAGRGRSAR